MAFINLPPSLQGIIAGIENRLAKLELGKRFTFPNVSSDPANPRNGDAWLNTTSNTPKYVDATGAVSTFGGGGGGGVPFSPRYIKANYAYGSIVPATLTTSSLPVNQTMYATPIYIPTAATATSIGIYVTTLAGTTSMGIRLGLYTNSATDDYPDARVAGSDSFIETSTTFGATGWNYSVVSLSLTAGLYWLVSVRQATSAPTTNCLSSTITGNSPIPAISIVAGNNTPAVAYSQTGVTGALPATFTTTKTTQAGVVQQVVLGF